MSVSNSIICLKSSRENRTQVSIESYNELFSSIPWHPQLDNSVEKEQEGLAEKRMLYGYLVGPHSDILDIGAGTASWIRYLSSVYQVLRANGVYAFETPNRLNRPHDISRYFDKVATGFHLKEWSCGELADRLKEAGFRKICTMILPWGLVKRLPFLRSLGTVPISMVIPGEMLVEKTKDRRRRNALCKCFRIDSIFIIAQK